MKLILSRGLMRETVVAAVTPKRVTPEIIECDCPECGGTGSWLQFHPEPELFPNGLDCVECKGTGRIYA